MGSRVRADVRRGANCRRRLTLAVAFGLSSGVIFELLPVLDVLFPRVRVHVGASVLFTPLPRGMFSANILRLS